MSDRWWAIPHDRAEAFHADQAVVEKEFGDDFYAQMVDGFAIVASPDGHVIGLEFVQPDGSRTRVSLDFQTASSLFLARLMQVLETAIVRAAPPAGRA